MNIDLTQADWDLLSSYAGLLFLASFSVYVGAYGSLPNPKQKAGSPVDDEDVEITERMSSEDAWLFPVIGSVALFGLYAVVKYFGTEWINWLLGWYFSIAGVGSVWNSSISLVRLALGESRWKSYEIFRLTIKKGSNSLVSLSSRTPSLLLFPIAAIPSAVYTFSSTNKKSPFITDLLALSFSHNALSFLRIDSFKTGLILLSGLFLYDIWWVFGTEVMVKVATSLDVPIKLLWPKSLVFSDERGFTMLGLGDIVIPGTFVALALRYDLYRSNKLPGKGTFRKPYFYASLLAYIIGLLTTMTVMHVYAKAQPALLYLSPACILSFVCTAALRGELKAAWSWSDEPEEDEQVVHGEGDKKVVEAEDNKLAESERDNSLANPTKYVDATSSNHNRS